MMRSFFACVHGGCVQWSWFLAVFFGLSMCVLGMYLTWFVVCCWCLFSISSLYYIYVSSSEFLFFPFFFFFNHLFAHLSGLGCVGLCTLYRVLHLHTCAYYLVWRLRIFWTGFYYSTICMYVCCYGGGSCLVGLFFLVVLDFWVWAFVCVCVWVFFFFFWDTPSPFSIIFIGFGLRCCIVCTVFV